MMTEIDLNEKLNKWIPILHLENWTIIIKYVSLKSSWGECDYEPPAYSATISLRPLTDKRWLKAVRDPETILVHELLHVVLVQFKIFELNPDEDKEEDIVNYLTKLLIAMERK